jgi:hypothetical protein
VPPSSRRRATSSGLGAIKKPSRYRLRKTQKSLYFGIACLSENSSTQAVASRPKTKAATDGSNKTRMHVTRCAGKTNGNERGKAWSAIPPTLAPRYTQQHPGSRPADKRVRMLYLCQSVSCACRRDGSQDVGRRPPVLGVRLTRFYLCPDFIRA